jgi:hypothetical protein
MESSQSQFPIKRMRSTSKLTAVYSMDFQDAPFGMKEDGLVILSSLLGIKSVRISMLNIISAIIEHSLKTLSVVGRILRSARIFRGFSKIFKQYIRGSN